MNQETIENFCLCNCCHFCKNHCKCDENCPEERDFEECQPTECLECIEDKEYFD